jgi:hypothetical protein
MENNFIQSSENLDAAEVMSDKEMLQEILENSRMAKNYTKWQLYITVALVVIPILAMVVIIPLVLRSIGNLYGGGRLLQ